MAPAYIAAQTSVIKASGSASMHFSGRAAATVARSGERDDQLQNYVRKLGLAIANMTLYALFKALMGFVLDLIKGD